MQGEFLGALVLIVDLILLGLATALTVDRVRNGFAKAVRLGVEERQRFQLVENESERIARVLEEQRQQVNNADRDLHRLQAELSKLQKQYEATDVPFNYTITILTTFDLHAPAWQFRVRHPTFGSEAAEDDVAFQWVAGRKYIVSAENQVAARSAIERQLPRHRDFIIEPLGRATPTSLVSVTSGKGHITAAQ